MRADHVEQWLRRGLGDALLATRVEELVRHRNLDMSPNDVDGEAALVMRAIAVLDPLAPLCWRGLVLWPDGIGTALAAAQASKPDAVVPLEEIILREECRQLGRGACGTLRFRHRHAGRGAPAARLAAAARRGRRRGAAVPIC